MAEARNASLAQQSAVNVSSLILDLHRNPPAFDTVVRLSWIDEETESLPPKEGRTSNWTSEETDSFLGVILEHGQAILKPGNGKAIAMQKKNEWAIVTERFNAINTIAGGEKRSTAVMTQRLKTIKKQITAWKVEEFQDGMMLQSPSHTSSIQLTPNVITLFELMRPEMYAQILLPNRVE